MRGQFVLTLVIVRSLVPSRFASRIGPESIILRRSVSLPPIALDISFSPPSEYNAFSCVTVRNEFVETSIRNFERTILPDSIHFFYNLFIIIYLLLLLLLL